MKLPSPNRVPFWIAIGIVTIVCIVHLLRLDFLERLEAVTYDMRVRQALKTAPAATNLFTFVYIDEQTLEAVQDGYLGYRFGLYWPRQVYGRLLQELSERGAKAVGIDVIFGEPRPDHPSVHMLNGTLIESDEYFALQLRRCTNAILALSAGAVPPPIFLTNAALKADISTYKDRDGILRRARAFRMYRDWHPLFRQLADDPGYGVDLERAIMRSNSIVLARNGMEDIVIPLNNRGEFDLADLAGGGLPETTATTARPYVEQRIWHMGVVMAACHLGLDLDHAEVNQSQRRIRLRGPNGTSRILPVDQEGYFLVDWSLAPNDPRLGRVPMQALLLAHKQRIEKLANTNKASAMVIGDPELPDLSGKLVVVGSAAISGNDLVDRGATPYSPDTLLVAKHWNVANSIIANRFVHQLSLVASLGIIVCLGIIAAIVTWKLRPVSALVLIVLAALCYVALATIIFATHRLWIPIALPVVGALFGTYIVLVTWKVVFEQADKRHVSGVLSTIVSPKVARELLKAEKLSLGGARREVTVLFADVRGFTELTDSSQEQAEQAIRQKNLTQREAETLVDEQARHTLQTVNTYLGTLAEIVLEHEGTLDKFIGDCVMAFWGAPTVCSNHAVLCVRAAVAGQRAIEKLNREREALNRQIEKENQSRVAAGLPLKRLLPILRVGTGINTGMATVGLMGSEVQAVVRQGNYTVFGREVNLASRLEALSGTSRIFISQCTYDHLKRDDPSLAALCGALPSVTVKGIRVPVAIYEVRWDAAGQNEGSSAEVPIQKPAFHAAAKPD